MPLFFFFFFFSEGLYIKERNVTATPWRKLEEKKEWKERCRLMVYFCDWNPRLSKNTLKLYVKCDRIDQGMIPIYSLSDLQRPKISDSGSNSAKMHYSLFHSTSLLLSFLPRSGKWLSKRTRIENWNEINEY